MAEATQEPATNEWAWDHRLERGWSRTRWAAARLVCRIFPHLAAAALEIDAAGPRAEGVPQLFARDLKEIDPRLNDDLLELFGIRYPASVLAIEWESVTLPWIGGLLLVPGEGGSFRMLDCTGNRVGFEWSGKQYALEF